MYFIVAGIALLFAFLVDAFFKAAEFVFLLPIPLKLLEFGFENAEWWDVIWPYLVYKAAEVIWSAIFNDLTS